MKLTSMGLSPELLEASRTVLQNSKEYEEFFQSALKKFGVDSPADFKSDEEKKKFFDYIDKNYNSSDEKGEDGKKESVKEGELPPALKKAIDKKKEKEEDKEVDEGATPSKKFVKIK